MSNSESANANGQTFQIRKTVTITSPDRCSIYYGSFTIMVENPGGSLEDGDRILLGTNWNLNLALVPGEPELQYGLSQFYFPVGPNVSNDRFPLVQRVFEGALQMIPVTAQVLNETGQAYSLAPIGGTGTTALDCSKQTWNFFDITDQKTLGLNNVSSVLGPLGENLYIQAKTNLTNTNFRQAGLYLAKIVS